MILLSLLIIPMIGILFILLDIFQYSHEGEKDKSFNTGERFNNWFQTLKHKHGSSYLADKWHKLHIIVYSLFLQDLTKSDTTLADDEPKKQSIKFIALITSIINLIISLIMFMLFDFSANQFQFVQESYQLFNFHIYLGIDGISIYFVLLTTLIVPISLLSNWTSISHDIKSYVIIMLLLETLLLAVFLVLDILLFYIFFESILPPLFLLIGLYGSSNKVRASFYLFLYTLLGSLFLLLSILTMSSIMGNTDFDALYKTNFNYSTQLLLFIGIFIAFAVKTPTIFLNTWLLKAHVESPLGGSILLAGCL